MALFLLVTGIVLLVAGARDKSSDLFDLLKKDFTGKDNFLEWILAFVLIGAIGYIPKAKQFSTALLALVILVIFLKKGQGFFANLQAGVNATGAGAGQSNNTFPGFGGGLSGGAGATESF